MKNNNPLRVAMITIFYRLGYDDSAKGYYIKKRIWVWLLLSPVFIPFYILPSVPAYFKMLFTYYENYIKVDKRSLTFKEKIFFKEKLIH